MLSDGYAQWYANRLWQMLPPIYRTMDAGPSPGSPGPLQELVNRIGAQAAVVRRSIDRLGENQSIETCDDWVIPYIGDLVATRLVSCLDAAAQRIDVAKTIYYRRRAGTVGVLEELAAFAGCDTGDDVRTVIDRKLRVLGAEAAGDALNEDFGIGFNEYGHVKNLRFQIYDFKIVLFGDRSVL